MPEISCYLIRYKGFLFTGASQNIYSPGVYQAKKLYLTLSYQIETPTIKTILHTQ